MAQYSKYFVPSTNAADTDNGRSLEQPSPYKNVPSVVTYGVGEAPTPCVRVHDTEHDLDEMHVEVTAAAEFPHPSQFGPQEYWQASTFSEKLAEAFAEFHARTSGMLAKVIASKLSPHLRALIGGETREYASLKEKFDALAKAWEDHNRALSVADYDHISYAQVIGMGDRAVPLLLAKLEEGEGDWIYALKCITGVQAESTDMHGDPDAVIAAWLKWGKQHASAYPRR